MARYSPLHNPVSLRTRGKADRFNWFVIISSVVIGLLVITLIGVSLYAQFVTSTHTDCVVTEKDRTRNSDGSSDARVYTENCGVFRVADSLLDVTWSSSDTFAHIKEGETYDLHTRGLRVPFLSMFPNIVEAEAK